MTSEGENLNRPKVEKGLVIGSFDPLHLGHLFVFAFAREAAQNVSILVLETDTDLVPIQKRFEWLKEEFPAATVIKMKIAERPESEDEYMSFAKLIMAANGKFDAVIGSDEMAYRVALQMNAKQIFPLQESVSSDSVQAKIQPFDNWKYLPACVKGYLTIKVCLFGPECTGKTRMARELAKHFNTVFVEEYARSYFEMKDNDVHAEEVSDIALGQLASEDFLARLSQQVLFCDTDLISTTIWCKWMYEDKCPEWVRMEAERRQYDLYLLMDIDVPWQDDSVRCLPNNRKEFFDDCKEALDSRGRKYKIISGPFEERFANAVSAVEELLRLKKKKLTYEIKRPSISDVE